MCEEGDLVEIPLPNGEIAIGWILHISEYFDQCVGFAVLGIKGHRREDIITDDTNRDSFTMNVLCPLYTTQNAIKHYKWKTFAHKPLSEKDHLLTKRIVGGGIYVCDEYLGPADEVSRKQLPPMLVSGMLSVYTKIEDAFFPSDENVS